MVILRIFFWVGGWLLAIPYIRFIFIYILVINDVWLIHVTYCLTNVLCNFIHYSAELVLMPNSDIAVLFIIPLLKVTLIFN